MAGGRPPIPPEDVKAWQELYLELLSHGKTEAEVSAVDGMPSWPIRYGWQKDEQFLINRQGAKKQGAAHILSEATRRYDYVYDRAIEDSASPQLVTACENFGKHSRWMSSRMDPEEWGDKKDITSGGEKIKAGVIMVATDDDKKLLEDL